MPGGEHAIASPPGTAPFAPAARRALLGIVAVAFVVYALALGLDAASGAVVLALSSEPASPSLWENHRALSAWGDGARAAWEFALFGLIIVVPALAFLAWREGAHAAGLCLLAALPLAGLGLVADGVGASMSSLALALWHETLVALLLAALVALAWTRRRARVAALAGAGLLFTVAPVLAFAAHMSVWSAVFSDAALSGLPKLNVLAFALEASGALLIAGALASRTRAGE